ncbi:MAG: hypothetical protein Q8918_15865 [Bacteroidota bacterium]|nr:hypothetical protein [Bacteroidota bacterium]MDP4213085.1 hypothetical protein [Bacteroidota bacterium]MDP4251579.1 hypothetical protein [Bacteroidota bacterium]
MQIIRSIQNTQDAINYIWEVTKGLTAAQLSNWTHLKGSLWSESYNKRDKEIIISNDLIKNTSKARFWSMPRANPKPPQEIISEVVSAPPTGSGKDSPIESENQFLEREVEVGIRREHLIMLRANNVDRIEYARKS